MSISIYLYDIYFRREKVLETEEAFLLNKNSLNGEKCWVLYLGPLNTWNLDTLGKKKEWISQHSWKGHLDHKGLLCELLWSPQWAKVDN